MGCSHRSEDPALYVAPLCPAGHLPHKGGDWLAVPPSPITREARSLKLPISPLEGEMSGRTEVGAKDHHDLSMWNYPRAIRASRPPRRRLPLEAPSPGALTAVGAAMAWPP